MTFEGHFGNLPTVVTLCAQLTCDLLAIAKFLVKPITSLLVISVTTKYMIWMFTALLRSNEKFNCCKEAALCFRSFKILLEEYHILEIYIKGHSGHCK